MKAEDESCKTKSINYYGNCFQSSFIEGFLTGVLPTSTTVLQPVYPAQSVLHPSTHAIHLYTREHLHRPWTFCE